MSDIQIDLASDNPQFDAHAYTIVIKRVVIDGEPVFHGRVIELPDLEAFEPTYDEAHNFLIDGIQNSKAAFDEQGRPFPAPLPDETPEFSGRVTSRMPAWLHAQLDYSARAQQTSLNQYMVTLLSWAASAAPSWVAQTQTQTQTIGTWASAGTAGMVALAGTAGTVTFSEPATVVRHFYTGVFERLQNLQVELEGVSSAADQELPMITALTRVAAQGARSGKRVLR